MEIENKVAAAGEPRSSQGVASPTAGVVVLPRPWLSLYSNYARGVAPPAPGQYLEDGRGLAPSENDSVEGGAKAELFTQSLSVTVAAFRARRTNVPETDSRGFYRQIGEAESRGFEIEAVGSVARGLGLRGGYALTSTEITRDTAGFAGRELPDAPRHKAQVWARYRVLDGALKSLMVAGGFVAVSSQYSARDNIVSLPGYTRFDASTSYTPGGSRLTIALIAQNLTDRRYATSGSGAVFIAAPLRRTALQLTTAF